jgi:hypothetical protein
MHICERSFHSYKFIFLNFTQFLFIFFVFQQDIFLLTIREPRPAPGFHGPPPASRHAHVTNNYANSFTKFYSLVFADVCTTQMTKTRHRANGKKRTERSAKFGD